MAETEKSIGNPHDRDTLSSSIEVNGPQSLGNQATYAGAGQRSDNESLGDQPTLGGLGESLEKSVSSDMEIVDLAARYKIEGVIGKGGMGEVLLAIDKRLNRKVAIKRILGSAAKNPTAVNRFLTEAQSIAALNHPNIVQIYDYGREKDGPFLIMEYVDGSNLLDKCQAGAMALEEAVDLACQLCDGLAKAHAAGIIHRDIKPANVLLSRDGVPKLTDFGLAKVETGDTGMTMAGAVLGTLDFMPPEQRRDAALTDARSDQWSLAATLYQMVTGEPPRVIDLEAVPQSLRAPLSQALKSKKDDRYPSVREFGDALLGSLKPTTTAPEIVSADLGAGECPKCHTRNEAHRKFCRECASPLRCSCLTCQAEIAVWDKVCGECGGQQSVLLEQRIEAMAFEQARAEKYREELEFEQAEQLARQLGKEPDLRLQQLKGWSERFLLQVANKKQEQLERVAALVTEALKHKAVHDYQAAIHALQQVPPALMHVVVGEQSQTAGQLLEQFEGQLAECKRLEQLIMERIASRQLSGLLTEVDRLLRLLPLKADVLKLKQQLIERESNLRQSRDVALAAAERLAAIGNYKEALRELGKIDDSVVEPAHRKLENELQRKAAEVGRLDEEITAALAAKRYSGLLESVTAYLELRPLDVAKQALREKLQAREAKNSASLQHLLGNVSVLRAKGKLTDAINLLSKIPPDLETIASRKLRAECQELEIKRTKQRAKLAKIMGALLLLLVVGIASTAMLLASMGSMELVNFDRVKPTESMQIPPSLPSSGAASKLITNSLGMKLSLIPAGTFMMGSPATEADRDTDEVQHRVTLTKDYYLGTTEVTQGQWESVMGTTPWKGKNFVKEGPHFAATYVSWDDAVEFCKRLSAREGKAYRLPTEAEWECACRGGTTSAYVFGDNVGNLSDYAWFDKNAWDIDEKFAREVGLKRANSFGLYDMHGNVYEWCSDWFAHYPTGNVTDPLGPSQGSWRVNRGGSWMSAGCRSARRGQDAPDLRSHVMGFRVALGR